MKQQLGSPKLNALDPKAIRVMVNLTAEIRWKRDNYSSEAKTN